jgi:adenylate kinase family enzyme
VKIALVGSPGAGKTELATQLLEKLPKSAVVDDYISQIEDRSDVKLGHFATYIGNVQVAIGRIEAERSVLRDKEPDHLITCGSLLETCVYTAINGYMAQQNNESFVKYVDDKRISTTMMWYGIFGFDTLDYDHIFYLPLSDEEKETNGRRWDTMVDEQIVEAAESLGVKVKTLPTDREARLGEVLQEVGVEAPASV